MTTYIDVVGDGWRFQPRVAAVCVSHDHVLLQHALDGDFWVLPGGRLLPLETSVDALARTMRWELDQQVAVGGLLWVMEYVTRIGELAFHELGFYYAIDLPPNSPYLDLGRDHAGVERGHDLLLRWFSIDAVRDLSLKPDFLRAALQHLPGSPQHVVRVDPEALPSVEALAVERPFG